MKLHFLCRSYAVPLAYHALGVYYQPLVDIRRSLRFRQDYRPLRKAAGFQHSAGEPEGAQWDLTCQPARQPTRP